MFLTNNIKWLSSLGSVLICLGFAVGICFGLPSACLGADLSLFCFYLLSPIPYILVVAGSILTCVCSLCGILYRNKYLISISMILKCLAMVMSVAWIVLIGRSTDAVGNAIGNVQPGSDLQIMFILPLCVLSVTVVLICCNLIASVWILRSSNFFVQNLIVPVRTHGA